MLLIEELAEYKKYKLETLYLAFNMADRYLACLLADKRALPNLITLAVAALLLTSKIEEHMSPNFNRMIRIMAKLH